MGSSAQQFVDPRGSLQSAPSDLTSSLRPDRVTQAQYIPMPWRFPIPIPPPGYPTPPNRFPTLADQLWQLYQYFRGSFGSGGGGDAEDPECRDQRTKARETCRDEMSKPMREWDRYKIGPVKSMDDLALCMKGLMSQKCGGKNVDWGPKGPPPGNWVP
jgi:hypothetical protein